MPDTTDPRVRAALRGLASLPAGANPREYWPDLTDDERDLVVANERAAAEERKAAAMPEPLGWMVLRYEDVMDTEIPVTAVLPSLDAARKAAERGHVVEPIFAVLYPATTQEPTP